MENINKKYALFFVLGFITASLIFFVISRSKEVKTPEIVQTTTTTPALDCSICKEQKVSGSQKPKKPKKAPATVSEKVVSDGTSQPTDKLDSKPTDKVSDKPAAKARARAPKIRTIKIED